MRDLLEDTGAPNFEYLRTLEVDDAVAYSTSFVADHYPPPSMTSTWEDPGRVALAMWASARLTWGDLEPVDYGIEAAEVAEDPERYLGARACFQVSVVDWPRETISRISRVRGRTTNGRIVDALTVGTSRPQYEGEPIELCGFIMGRHGRPELDANAGVSLVGMIDSYENRARLPIIEEPHTP